MTDFPLELDAGLTDRFARALDAERKVARAVAALGEVADRDVLLVDGVTTLAGQLRELGARVVAVSSVEHQVASAGNGAADVVVAAWSPVTVATDDELAEAVRLTRPGGRLLVVHDYGRDDLALLRGEEDRPAYGLWSRRDGPFLSGGFRVRVIHAWLTFATVEEAASFLVDAFGSVGQAFAARLSRPRLSYNVAVYHRTVGGSGA